MKQLKAMKEQLTSIVQGQLSHPDSVDTKELGEAVDMIKDLAETMYYCSITEAMEDSEKEQKKNGQYYPPMEYYGRYRDPMMFDGDTKIYYGGNRGGMLNSPSYGQSGNSGRGRVMYGGRINPVYYNPDMMIPDEMYREYPYDENMMHDPREGRSRKSRKMYMESKELHKDSATQMKELEKYMQDLSADIMEMIEKASPEEKEVLHQKISTLASKMIM